MAIAALLGLACASAPPIARRAECPAPGPRAPAAHAFAFESNGDPNNGALLFARVCTRCHAGAMEEREQPEAPSHAPRLDCGEWLAATSDAYLYDAINRGPGRYGHGTLPPLGEQLPPAQISDLVAYLRSLATP